jgi:dUTP pyrophosphatase
MTDNNQLTKVDKIFILNKSSNPNPEYKTEGSAGFDIASNESILIPPHTTVLVGTGLYFSMMDGYEAQLRLRSSWGFRGEIKLCLRNLNIESVRVKAGDRVAQVVCSPVFCPKIHIMDSDEWNSPLNKTLRGEGGFGSTGEQ